LKKVIISVSSDLVTDQRVHKVALTLGRSGYDVLLVGRRKRQSLPLESRTYRTLRLNLFFETGPLFYAALNLRLLFLLLFTKADILLANDLDTLLPNFIVSWLKKLPLVYDSHEYYTGVPELQHRPLVRGVWKSVERYIFPRLKHVYTVNASIAGLYEKEYGIPVKVIRNVPYLEELPPVAPSDFPDGNIILYQGAGINIQRGVEEAVEAMQFVQGATLLIIGGGDAIHSIRELAERLKLGSRVVFRDKMPFALLRAYTGLARLGLSLDKDTNINYRFSLPNKLFDYIHAGVPVLASPLPEVKRIVERYEVGVLIESHDPAHIAERILYMLSEKDEYEKWKANTRKAAQELCWQNEEKVLTGIFKELET
jgi:glycosyltransferase involved in cell wall biosynthesis